MLDFLKAPFKAQCDALYLQYINNFPDSIICNITLYEDNTTVYFKCDQASNLWQ